MLTFKLPIYRPRPAREIALRRESTALLAIAPDALRLVRMHV